MAAINIKIKMVSTATKKTTKGREKPTGYFKTTTKNPRNHPEKLELKMYDPIARVHAIFKEQKVK